MKQIRAPNNPSAKYNTDGHNLKEDNTSITRFAKVTIADITGAKFKMVAIYNNTIMIQTTQTQNLGEISYRPGYLDSEEAVNGIISDIKSKNGEDAKSEKDYVHTKYSQFKDIEDALGSAIDVYSGENINDFFTLTGYDRFKAITKLLSDYSYRVGGNAKASKYLETYLELAEVESKVSARNRIFIYMCVLESHATYSYVDTAINELLVAQILVNMVGVNHNVLCDSELKPSF